MLPSISDEENPVFHAVPSDGLTSTSELIRYKRWVVLTRSLSSDVQENLKAKRDGGRQDIVADFNAHVAGKKKAIERHYNLEATKRATETKGILVRYTRAIERRASIEKSIEEVVSNMHKDLEDFKKILEAAYTGRREQSHAAAGSFAFVTKGTTSASPTNRRRAMGRGAVDAQDDPWIRRARKEGHARGDPTYARDTKHQNQGRGESIFDEISW
ncbi:hypothetical protein NUW58_g574 [Xylaria curta]|uniref:Uncharacterized protein n=1 Tax=Xylaria curta TaxID=42375 RepID=A0ACC1PQ44_9PEZI|nr:hypothetical protein NUW58_g574 [Xylaria curta]